jgi:hypothetical protein
MAGLDPAIVYRNEGGGWSALFFDAATDRRVKPGEDGSDIRGKLLQRGRCVNAVAPGGGEGS